MQGGGISPESRYRDMSLDSLKPEDLISERPMLRVCIALLLVAFLHPQTGQGQSGTVVNSILKAQIFSDLGTHHRAITTDSVQAQDFFDQGLTWMYAFNHDEAVRSFRRAAELNQACARLGEVSPWHRGHSTITRS